MTTRDITLSNFQVKQIFEEFNRKLNEPGETAKYSWFVYKTCESLINSYNALMNELYDERREPEFPAFYKEQQDLVQKYADRDENNNIITDQNGSPMFNENIVEFNNANAELTKKYETLYEKIKNKDKVNYDILSKSQTYTLTCLELSEFPAKTSPFIVGIFGY